MQPQLQTSDETLLASSTLAAARILGLNQTAVSDIIGRNRSTIARNGIDPGSKAGQLALLLLRVYRSLAALMGGDESNMRHFMRTHNHGTGGIPRDQMLRPEGLVAVCEYLDAIRGRA